jgi:hypothetical protein
MDSKSSSETLHACESLSLYKSGMLCVVSQHGIENGQT